MANFITLLLVIALFQLIGGVIAYFFSHGFSKHKKKARFVEILLMVFIVIELVRQGIEISGLTIFAFGLGFLVLYLLNKLIKHKHEGGKLGKLVFLAIIFHEIPQGLAFGSSFAVAPDLGVIIAFFFALHNIPEGGLYALPFFLKHKVSKGFLNLVFTQFAFLAAGILAFGIISSLSMILQNMFLAFGAGALLFLVIEEGFYLTS